MQRWGTQWFRGPTGRNIKCCGIPRLAKNERDMGHPVFVEGIDGPSKAAFMGIVIGGLKTIPFSLIRAVVT